MEEQRDHRHDHGSDTRIHVRSIDGFKQFKRRQRKTTNTTTIVQTKTVRKIQLRKTKKETRHSEN